MHFCYKLSIYFQWEKTPRTVNENLTNNTKLTVLYTNLEVLYLCMIFLVEILAGDFAFVQFLVK